MPEIRPRCLPRRDPSRPPPLLTTSRHPPPQRLPRFNSGNVSAKRGKSSVRSTIKKTRRHTVALMKPHLLQ
ncbi:hypothetical protein ACLOJK_019255 [Asimina triloba]